MIKKIFVILILFFAINVVYAGSYEDAMAKYNNVFLYLYTKDCSTCRNFDKTFNQIQSQNKDYGFVKVDADTSYGRKLMLSFKGRYVPYIVLTDVKKNKIANVSISCVMDEICLIRAMKSFKG